MLASPLVRSLFSARCANTTSAFHCQASSLFPAPGILLKRTGSDTRRLYTAKDVKRIRIRRSLVFWLRHRRGSDVISPSDKFTTAMKEHTMLPQSHTLNDDQETPPRH